MSSKTAAIVNINYKQCAESRKNIIHFLMSELKKIDFNVNIMCMGSNLTNLSTQMKVLSRDCDVMYAIGETSVMYEIISKAFGKKLVYSKHLTDIYNMNGESEILVPEMSNIFQLKINDIKSIAVQYGKIYVLPDHEKPVKTIFNRMLCHLLFTKEKLFRKIYKRDQCQNDFEQFGELLDKFENKIDMKYFCEVRSDKCLLNIELSDSNFNIFIEFNQYLKGNLLMDESTCDNECDKFWTFYNKISQVDLEYIQEAVNIIEECYEKYCAEDIILCFNGGKDCTALLYLILKFLKDKNYNNRLLCLYIQQKNPFTEVEDFIEECRQFHNLEVITICSDVKSGLSKLLNDHPNLKACFMGTRKTDPYSETLDHFQMTDANWPQIMRVSPILNWTYSELWKYLLQYRIPYCILYDQGYTSLGSTLNTVPNPALKCATEDKHLPAFQLEDASLERSGRLKH